jgi:hypothetical protein
MAARGVDLQSLEAAGIDLNNLENLAPLQAQQLAQMQHELGAQQLTDQELYQIQVRDLDLEEW